MIAPSSAAFSAAEKLRAESVIRIDGKVVARTAETVNANLPTGGVEVQASAIEVLGAAEELPLPVFGEPDYPEDIRLKYRFLDLRREKLHRSILLRSQVIASLRRRMLDQVGLAEVRGFRLRHLEAEEAARLSQLEAQRNLLPDLEPLTILSIEPA